MIMFARACLEVPERGRVVLDQPQHPSLPRKLETIQARCGWPATQPRSFFRLARNGVLLVAALLVSGCAGYRLGPTNGHEAGAQSVQVVPFLNHSTEPGLADELTASLRKAIQIDGTLKLETQGGADWVVQGVITDYQRRAISLLSEDVRTVRDYQVSLVVRFTVRDRSGSVVMEKDVTEGTVLRVGDDLSASERQTATILAGDLAERIANLIVDGDW